MSHDPLRSLTARNRPRGQVTGVLMPILLWMILCPSGPLLVAHDGTASGLSRLFELDSGMTRDSNNDGIADRVAARVIVPERPSQEDRLAAANIAARLGFESMAMTFPVVLRADAVTSPEEIELPILVGHSNPFIRSLIDKGAIEPQKLSEGQGLVAHVVSPLGGPDGVVIAGSDDAGTLAAALEFAARLPRVWRMTGITLRGIETELTRILHSRGLEVSAVNIDSLIVDTKSRGLSSVHIRVELPSRQTRSALEMLREIDRAHRQGREPHSLNFANVATVTLAVYAAGQTVGQVDVHRSGLNSRTLTPPIEPDELAPDSPGERGRPAITRSVRTKRFDLATAFSIYGWFGDAYRDLIPDRTETSLIIGPESRSVGAAHIAARLGLESTGVTFPIAKPDKKVREPQKEPSPILVGRNNSLVRKLEKIGKIQFEDLEPGEGAIQVIPEAFGKTTATVVAGADDAGTDAASLYLAGRAPYLWDPVRGAPSFGDVATEVSRFFRARSGSGQASQSLVRLERVLSDLEDSEVESFDATLFIEKADPTLDTFLRKLIEAKLEGARVSISSQGVTDPIPVFEESFDVPWEVDEFWSIFERDVIPRVKAGSKVELETRLSESPRIRGKIAARALSALHAAGASDSRVRVLSAYKQGFLWLTEEVIPSLRGKGVQAVQIKIGTIQPDLSKKFKFYPVPTRWLHELYPVDEIFERELGVDKKEFSLELVDHPEHIYTLTASNKSGKVVRFATFDPKFVEREYLDKFPGWARFRVTTGWLSASVDGHQVVDQRIATDPERFWDHYQSKILNRIYDHVMEITQKKPMPDKQPFHRDLDIEVWMSEPDFRIDLDEEQVSSLESLHEDLYFVTLDFFDALGRETIKKRLAAPGKILPIIHPARDGRPGRARVLYAGNASAEPKLVLTYKLKGTEKPVEAILKLEAIDVTEPEIFRAVVGKSGIKIVELAVRAKNDQEAARAVDAVDALDRFHQAGLCTSCLSYDHVDEIAVTVILDDARAKRLIHSTGDAAPSRVLHHSGPLKHPLVTWDHVISPDESEEIIEKLSAYPEVSAFRAGHSYRGRDISVLEITSAPPDGMVSLAKETTYKPTILITGRQHANEVSSTSHILKLAERLVTEPSYKEILKKVNIILHPVENPDGAQIAYDLQKLTPTHMLHAGRYSAIGMDVASQVGRPDPILPEARVRGRLWRDWLPDIYLNPHGYPSHEWVQQFAGYVPPRFRSYLSSRGWYTSVRGLRDPRYPHHAEVAAALREAIVRQINSNPEVRALNLRHQTRYRRWAFGFQPYVYNQEIYKDTAIYYGDPETGEPGGSRRAGEPTSSGRPIFPINAWPQVTYFRGGTEAPDETAQGEWLNLVSQPGFSYLMACIQYLRNGAYTVERIGEEDRQNRVTLTLFRPRPVLPPGKSAQE